MNAEIIARLAGNQRSLRDWFAGLAMQAGLRNLGRHYHADEGEVAECKATTARLAYQTADAMLAERER